MVAMVNVSVTGTVRVISSLKKKPLTDAEQFTHTMKIMDGIPYTALILNQLAKGEIRDAFEEVFRERLKKVPALKNSIGGTRWMVDTMNVEYEVEPR